MLNAYWNGKQMPSELTQAQVILLFKKGDKSKLSNYRPISLLNTNYKLLTVILQKRLSQVLDQHLQTTQYGFRQKRSTIQALHYVRRIIEKGEKTNTKTLLVLLDWEKAFDKVIHTKLFEALTRMNVPTKYVNVIKEIYRQPSFKVAMEGRESTWTNQQTGIRQGCPLSPYLFLIVMTCLFHDIHKNDRLKMREHRVLGMEANEVLYADDTICISEDEEAMNRLLSEIEILGNTYGLKLNKVKCEYLKFGDAGPVYFADGTRVPVKEELKYLGCNMNNKGDPGREVNRRIRECMATLSKLHVFFYNSENTPVRKVQVFNLVIRSKVMYGLETIVMNDGVLSKLNAFQLKCLRKC